MYSTCTEPPIASTGTGLHSPYDDVLGSGLLDQFYVCEHPAEATGPDFVPNTAESETIALFDVQWDGAPYISRHVCMISTVASHRCANSIRGTRVSGEAARAGTVTRDTYYHLGTLVGPKLLFEGKTLAILRSLPVPPFVSDFLRHASKN